MKGFNIPAPEKRGHLISVDVCAIDADIIAYKVASACDGKFYIYNDKEYGLLKDIKKEYQDNFNRDEVGTIFEPEEWEEVESSIKGMMGTIKYDVKAEKYLSFMSNGPTFRNDIATIIPYKGNRDKRERVPHWLSDAKEFIKEEFGGVYGDNVEADDLLYKGDVIASIDKDLLTIPSLHYNIDKRTIVEVSTLDADKNFYKQVLTGDRVDNVLGLFGVGAKSKLCKDVDSCTTVEEMHSIVFKAYSDRFGSYATAMMEENCRLLWILQEREPYFKEALSQKGMVT